MALAAAAITMLLGCSDQQPAGPSGVRRDDAPAERWETSGTFSIPLLDDQPGVPLTSTGITLTAAQRGKILVSGGVGLDVNANYAGMCGPGLTPPLSSWEWGPFCPTGAPYAGQSRGPQGFGELDDAARVVVYLQRPDGQVAPVTYGTAADQWIPEVIGPGTVYVSRRGFSDAFIWKGVPIFKASGSETVTVLTPSSAEPCGALQSRSGGGARLDVSGGCSTDPPPPPKLLLECNGSMTSLTVTRATPVNCIAKSDVPAAQITVRSWDFAGHARTDGSLTALTWGGPVVRAGTVRVVASVNGTPDQTAQVEVRVQPRAWNEVRLTKPPQVLVQLEPETMDLPPQPTLPGGPVRAFGRFVLPIREIGRHPERFISVTPVTEGPNSGLSYVTGPPEMPAPTIYLHPALYPNGGNVGTPTEQALAAGWYNDQNGRGSGTCTAADLARFEPRMQHHEGATMASDSHYGKTNDALQSFRLARKLEALIGEVGDTPVPQAIDILADFFNNKYKSVQNQFDQSDTQRVYATLNGCSFDFNPQDP